MLDEFAGALIPLNNDMAAFDRSDSDVSLFFSSDLTQLRRSRDDLQYVVDDIQRMARKAESLVELYRFCKESHQEQVLRTLTIVTTIFIPGQFMSGVWGMNFENMPELQLKYGYYLFWAIFVTMGSVVLLYFWSQGWFSHEARGAFSGLQRWMIRLSAGQHDEQLPPVPRRIRGGGGGWT